jgi:hypothetical protein
LLRAIEDIAARPRTALLALAAAGLWLATSTAGAQVAVPDTAGTEAPAAADTAAVRRIAPDVVGFESARVDLWDTGVSATAAVLMTPVFPGWGQLYADNSWRGALAYGVQMFYWTNILSRDRQARRSRDFAQTFPLYVGAHLFAFDEDPVPVPDRWQEQFGPPGGDMPGGALAPTLTVFQWRTTF